MLAACFGHTEEPAPTPIAEADFALSAAHALCDNIEPCCAQVGFPHDPAACVATRRKKEEDDIAQMRGNGATFDAAAATRCIAQIRETATACADLTQMPKTADCGALYVGTRILGDACDNYVQCAPSAEGAVACEHIRSDVGSDASSAGPGVASEPVEGMCMLHKSTSSKGDPCGTRTGGGSPPKVLTECMDRGATLYCNFGTKACQPRMLSGQSCASDPECALGTHCDGGKCVPLGAAGDLCTSACAAGFYCSRTSVTAPHGICAKKKNAGDACEVATDYAACAGGTCSRGKCSAGSYSTAEICTGS